MDNAVIYACSHRKGGNSDLAADLLAQGVRNAGGDADVVHLRDCTIRSCIACGTCDVALNRTGRERCVLGAKDQAWELFQPMLGAPVILFASPIYFYHLPSAFKTWIDRAQQFWKARMDGEPWVADLPKRPAYSVLVAGRPTGKKLFEGAQVTLKYFTWNFNVEPVDPLCFRGVDGPSDLSKRKSYTRQVTELGETAWNARVQRP